MKINYYACVSVYMLEIINILTSQVGSLSLRWMCQRITMLDENEYEWIFERNRWIYYNQNIQQLSLLCWNYAFRFVNAYESYFAFWECGCKRILNTLNCACRIFPACNSNFSDCDYILLPIKFKLWWILWRRSFLFSSLKRVRSWSFECMEKMTVIASIRCA